MQLFLLFLCAITPLLAQIVPDKAVPDSTVVAVIDGKEVTAAQIRAGIQFMPPEFQRMYDQNPKAAIQQMYVMNFLAAEGEKAKLDQQDPLKQQLAVMRANILASAMLSYEHNNYPVTQDMIKDAYNRNNARYKKAEIRWIVVNFKPALTGAANGSLEDVARGVAQSATGSVTRGEAEASKLAQEIVEKLKNGADFSKLASEVSEEPNSRAKGGEAPTVHAESPHPDEWKRLLFEKQAGDIVGPLKQGNSFYLIRLEKLSTQTVDEAQGMIVQELRQNHANEWFQEVLKRFTPDVKNVEFFTQTAPPIPAGLAPPAPAR